MHIKQIKHLVIVTIVICFWMPQSACSDTASDSAELSTLPTSLHENWLKQGWHKVVNSQFDAALAAWQAGINTLPDQQLLASFGAYAYFPNALAQIKLAGPQQQVFIIRQNFHGKALYHVLIGGDIAKDINERQQQLASLKNSTGITSLIYANESIVFKKEYIADPAHDAFAITWKNIASHKEKVQKQTTKTKAADNVQSRSFTINTFAINGNKRVSTDMILLGLRDFYGAEKTSADLNNIKQQVIEIYRMMDISQVRIKTPELIDDDTVSINITEP